MVEIRIGRQETGPNDIVVPDTYKKVGRHHGKIECDNGTLTYRDLDSTNGTFVNGERIAVARIKKGDDVRLGGLDRGDCFTLNVEEIMDRLGRMERECRTDFSQEFADMRLAYIECQNEVNALRRETAKKAQLPRLVATLVPALAGVVILLINTVPMTFRLAVMSLGTVASAIMGITGLNKNNDLTDDITDIQLKYQPRYKCPKCGKNIPLGIHWKKLEADGCCPHGCGAKYVKDAERH